MKKLIFPLWVTIILFTGCSSIMDAKGYHEVQKARWEAMNASAVAYNSKIETKLIDVDPTTGIITVYNQNQHEPIVIRDAPNAFVQGADVVLNSAVAKIVGGGWAAGYALGKVQGNNYTASGKGSITKDSGNSVNVETRSADGSITDETHTGSDYTTSSTDSNDSSSIIDDHADNRNNYDNATATPIIVEQPKYNDPIIVGGKIED